MNPKILLKICSVIFCTIFARADLSIIIPEIDDDRVDLLIPVMDHCCDEESGYRKLSIVIVDREPSLNFYRIINEVSKLPVEVLRGMKKLNSFGWLKSCVVIWLSANGVQEFFEKLESFSLEPSNLLVIHSPGRNGRISRDGIRRAGAVLWKNKYVHKLVVVVNESCLLFDPFEPYSFFGSEVEKFGAVKELANSSEPLKDREDFSGYEINVAIFPYVTARKSEDGDYSGLEGNAMEEITKRMNLTKRIYEPSEKFGWIDTEGKLTGSLGRMSYYESDIAFNEFFIKIYGTKNLENTVSIGVDEICAIVPRHGRLPGYLHIVRIFSLISWGMIFIGNSLIALVYIAIRRVMIGGKNISRKPRRTFARIPRFVGTWIFLCFYNAKPEAKWIGERLHIALGLCFGIIIGGSFTSKLASSFSKPIFMKNINTLEELDISGLKIVTNYPNLLMDVFIDDDSATLKNLHRKLKLVNISEVERHVFIDKDGAFLERRQSVLFDGNFNNTLHLVPECPRKYHLAYPIAKGSPFTRRLNTLIGRLNLSGIYVKWFRDMEKKPEPPEDRGPVVIRLHHLYIPFFMLFTGLGMATVVFYLERRRTGGSSIPTSFLG